MKNTFNLKTLHQSTLFIVSYFRSVAKYFNFDYYVRKCYRVDDLFMKKFVLLITILFVSVISTACINNLAVQELNNKAKEYMANGEADKAVARLRSSIDLDTSIFETHYNLGVALIATNEYEEAQEALKNAIKLKPDFADAYYSLALAYEGQAFEIIEGDDADADEQESAETKRTEDKKVPLTSEDKNKIVELLNLAVDNYNTYLTKKTDAKDKDKVLTQIEFLNQQVQEYNSLNSNSIEDLRAFKQKTQSGAEE